MKPTRILAMCASLLLVPVAVHGQEAPEKVIYDTDFGTLNDDGMGLIMLAQLHAAGEVDLLGITVVSGNQWLEQGLADALRAVERLGIQDVPVLAGAVFPLVHDYRGLAAEQALFGQGYSGAWRNPQPQSQADLEAPPDGFAAQTTAGEQHAVDFIIEQVKANPGEVTIVAIGPATNLALAIRLAPEISGQIRRIIWMGGSFDAMGNVTPAAEFNWWFDPEAVRIVLREPIPQVIVSLDVTNKVAMELEQYRAITEIANPTPITELWKTVYGERFSGPNPRRDIWDTIAVGYLADPDIVTDMRRFFVDVDTNFGPNYGRALGYAPDPDDPETPPLAMLQPADVIYEIDEARFWDKFTDLMTRPVPVAQP
jgi:inosine-uridine nucleoside N-ribohydrolase